MRTILMICVACMLLIAAEWTGKRRQEVIVRVGMGMIFMLYVFWKYGMHPAA